MQQVVDVLNPSPNSESPRSVGTRLAVESLFEPKPALTETSSDANGAEKYM